MPGENLENLGLVGLLLAIGGFIVIDFDYLHQILLILDGFDLNIV